MNDDLVRRSTARAAFAGGHTDKDESLPDYLIRRELELVQQTAAIRGLLAPKEAELAAVRKVMDTLGLRHGTDHSDFMATAAAVAQLPSGYLIDLSESDDETTVGFTIKQMILGALKDHFHDGATPTELRDYMRNVYGRDVDRNSISPQLARLREEGVVEQYGLQGKWSLKRSPPKHKTPVELTDKSSDEDIARYIKDRGLQGQVSVQAMRKQLQKTKIS